MTMAEQITARIRVAMARDGRADRVVVDCTPEALGMIVGCILEAIALDESRKVEALDARVRHLEQR